MIKVSRKVFFHVKTSQNRFFYPYKQDQPPPPPVDIRNGVKLWEFADHAIKSDLMSVYAAQMVEVREGGGGRGGKGYGRG